MEQKLKAGEEGFTMAGRNIGFYHDFHRRCHHNWILFIFSSKQMNNWRQSVNTMNEIHISSEILFKDLITAQTMYQTDSTLIINENDKRKIDIYGYEKCFKKKWDTHHRLCTDSHYVSGIVISDSISVIRTYFKYDKQIRKNELVVTNRQPTLWGDIE